MTAEEYIRKHSTWNAGTYAQNIYTNDAFDAVRMAREEEREKAVNALKTILSACNDCKDFYSVQCGTYCIIDKFKELLNK